MQQNSFTEEQIKTELSFWALLKEIWPFVRKYRTWFFSTLLFVALFVSAGRSLPFVIQWAIDEGILKKSMSIVYWAAGLYLGLELLRTLLHFTQTYYMQKLGNRLLYDIREKLMTHIQALPLRYFDKNPIGRTVTRATNDISSLGELFTEGFTDILVNLVEMLSIVVALSLISAPLTVIAILIAPFLVVISLKISKEIRHYFKESKKKMSSINSFTAETLNGMKVVHLFQQVESTRGQFDQLSQQYRNLQLNTVRLFAKLWPLIEFFNMGTVGSALFFGAYFQSELGLSIGQLSAFVLLLQGFFKPLRVILERYNQVQNAIASADRIFSLLNEPQENMEGSLPASQRIQGKIEIRDLSFQYEKGNPYALRKVSLNIHPGESVALVGRTGSGKTTLISLLQKLYPYKEGEILVDDIPLKELSTSFLRSRAGVVLQDPFLFRGTIASNISLNRPDISRERIQWAAEQAHCAHLGLDSPIEERGANLSAGERQLVAFARVLAFDPDLLILDEATSHVDSMTEQWVQDSIKKLTVNRTCLIIAHRLSTILHCDRIVVMHNSQLMEVGNHRELMEKNGMYAELFRKQFMQQGDLPCG